MGLVENVQNRLPVGGEFQGYNGDCVEYALMIGRAATSPQYPTTREELNRLTAESITAGQAGAAGQMTDANAAWLCGREGIPYQQIPFNANGLYYWLGIGHAVVCGFSNGQALPGNEPGVQGHAVCFLLHDGTGFTLANGDSANGRAGQLDRGVTTGQVVSAQPTTMTVIHPVLVAVDTAGIAADAHSIINSAQDILKKVGG